MANFQLIKSLAAERGKTIADLAEDLKISPAGVYTIIKTNSTSTTTIEQIAHILKVKVGVFFDEPEPAEEPQDPNSLIAQKDAIIAQKDKIIEQQEALIRVLTSHR